MARFFGNVGYATTEELPDSPGSYDELITEIPYFGDVVRNTSQASGGEGVIPDVRIRNSISVVADAYAIQHHFAIRYVVWAGVAWTVSSVSVEPPRLVLQLGDVYNGNRPS